MGWFPPGGVLAELISRAAQRAEGLRAERGQLERLAAAAPPRPSLLAALTGNTVAVIAEIKRASPSRGSIAPAIDAAQQAAAYVAGGAAAISVLTEELRFGGSMADLESASAAVRIPLLRKDFIVSEEQLLEAIPAGASGALLIARALRPERLHALARFARGIGLETLVEVRTRAELASALEAGATLVGVNARDLEDLTVDRDGALPLIEAVPVDIVCVAESGIERREDVERVAAAGADAVLVGTVLSGAEDVVSGVRSLTGVPRKGRRAGRR